MQNGWTERIEELEAEVAKLTGDLPPMQLTDNERRDGHSALRWNKGKQAIETFDPHPSVGLTDDDRKMLTEYLGECWHEIAEPITDWEEPVFCLKCKQQVSWTWTPPEKPTVRQHQVALNYHFTTPADLHAVYSKMVEKGEWSKFRRYAEYQYGLIPFLEPITEDEEANFDIDLEAWLFCLACPEQIPERMKLAAGWIRAKG